MTETTGLQCFSQVLTLCRSELIVTLWTPTYRLLVSEEAHGGGGHIGWCVGAQ
jgi:hypothetical protein